MEDRKEGLQGVWDQFVAGSGFVVAGHNYGRLDRMSREELEDLEKKAGAIAYDTARLLDGIFLAMEELDIAAIEGTRSKYLLQ